MRKGKQPLHETEKENSQTPCSYCTSAERLSAQGIQTEAPSGIIGLETSLPLAVTRLVKAGHIDYLTLFEKMCLNPAKLYRMKEAGRIREGGAADLVLFDDQTPYTVEKFHSKASNSPFVGAKLYGKVHYTICSGETVYRAE